MTWLITNHPYLSFVALWIGYSLILISGLLCCRLLALWIQEWRRDRAISKRMAKVDWWMEQERRRN